MPASKSHFFAIQFIISGKNVLFFACLHLSIYYELTYIKPKSVIKTRYIVKYALIFH